jgi:Flp pilus assembly CpaE family ATPase
MPCYLVQTVTITLTEADQTILMQAGRRLLWSVTQSDGTLLFTTTDGQEIRITGTSATVQQGQEPLLAALTTAYAQEMLTTVASQYGWTLEATNPERTEFVLEHY